MNSPKIETPGKRGETPTRRDDPALRDGKDPEWANGLRKLYDSVVDEPLPDSFRDLLSKLDAKD